MVRIVLRKVKMVRNTPHKYFVKCIGKLDCRVTTFLVLMGE